MLKKEEYLKYEIFYFSRNNKCIVLDFLEYDLQKRNFKLFQKTLAMLHELNKYFLIQGKYIDYLRNGSFSCFELRVNLKNDIVRIFFKDDDIHKRFVVLYGFIKKTQKTPLREIEKTEGYWKEYIFTLTADLLSPKIKS